MILAKNAQNQNRSGRRNDRRSLSIEIVTQLSHAFAGSTLRQTQVGQRTPIRIKPTGNHLINECLRKFIVSLEK